MNASASSSGFAQSVRRWTDSYPHAFFAVLSALYIALVWRAAQRPLWYDELFTFYIAKQPTVSRIMAALHTIDLNPPLNYFLTRWSIACFGAKPWATRLPEMVAFWIGSLAVLHLLRRRATALIAALGVLLLWSTPYFAYATEARPYGLLLGFSAILIAAWDSAADGQRRLALPLIAISGLLLLLSHVFGVLSLGAVWLGEIVRTLRQRKADLPMLIVLTIPLLAILTYGPLFRSAGAIVFPPEAAVTWGKLYYLYFSIFRWMWRPLIALVLIALLARKDEKADVARESPAFATILLLLFLVPVGLAVVFLISHGAFYDRYGMVTVLPIVVVAPIAFFRRVAREATQVWGCGAVLILLLFSTLLREPIQRATAATLPPKAALKADGVLMTSPHGPFRPWYKNLPLPPSLLEEREHAPQISSLDAFHPELPIVAASELTFFEMNQRESSGVDHRLYYLYDRDAELRIAHRSITDGVLTARQFFPVRSNLVPYESFIADHQQFLVIGTYEHPGDWLLRKLAEDGASMAIVAEFGGYADRDIYQVSMPPR